MELSELKLETLRQDGEFILYRGRHRRQTDATPPPILVLTPVMEHPAPGCLRRMEHEFSLKAELDPAWAVQPLALTQEQDRSFLLLDDPGAEPLDLLLEEPMELGQLLRFAIGLSAALVQLHARGLIHKDIKPANVLVNPATGQCWLMGFGIASRLPRERQSPGPPEFIAGTLAYMAPEQTGRMNRSIDSRSDLYSFGVSLYEMLTGSLPFTASDPMEWVHCHIAKQPIAPAERLKSFPAAVSAIIMKLLAKTAEQRYQTAAGVESDLRRCLAEWETQRRIDEFPLGQQDTPDRLRIPEKLYGRAHEVDTLLASFDRVVATGRPELVLVSGYSGIGKSSVVNELHKVLVPPQGLFASGKFDQYKRDIPYSTLAQAFQNLIRPLLSKSEAELDNWRDALQEALGPNGKLIVNLVPELQLITGEPPPVPELPLQEAQRRFQFVFRRFIGVFARPEHPLAFFLDDLQWLDSATLDLLEDLLTQSDVRHLMLIGAYRDNEVNSSHPLMRKLDTIRKAGAPVQEIVLAPLTGEDLAQLITDALHCEPERATALAELIHEKTAGNPFFAIQFISALVEEGLLTFDYDDGRWSWDPNSIYAKGYTDNVADLMVGKLNRLPVEAQQALQLLPCMGNSAEFDLLEMVSQQSNEEMHGQLWEAIRAGLIFRTEHSYTFSHDRVQEAAYSLIPEEARAEAHLRIGRLLATHIAPEKREETIFEIVNQFNRGVSLITAPQERERVAELNLIAGKRAKISTAYASALEYLVAGCALLAEDSWERRYTLTFALEFERAECEFLTGDFAAAEERLSILSERATNLVDSAAVTCLRAELYMTLDQRNRAVEVCLEYLRRIGVDWSPHPTKDQVEREYTKIWRQLGARAIEQLVDLPLMTDSDCRATLDVLSVFATPAWYADENLHDLVGAHMANLSLEHGNSDGSCHAYALLGTILGSNLGQYQAGFRFGKLAVDLIEKRGLHRFKARVYNAFGHHITPWARHLHDGRIWNRRAFNAAKESGDLTYAAFSSSNMIANLLAGGDPLQEVQREAEDGLKFSRKMRFDLVSDYIIVALRLIRTLRGLTPKFGSFNDAEFDESRFEQHLEENPGLAPAACRYWIRKLQACFYAEDYASAVAAAAKAHLVHRRQSFFEVAGYPFYSALAHAALCRSASADERARYLEAVATHYRQLAIWKENCPENFGSCAALVGAEMARLEGRELDAERLYEEAIHSAREHGFVQNEAIAHEVAARFYSGRSLEVIARAYLRNARYCYLRWGAAGKVRQLEELYPHLGEEAPVPAPVGAIGAPVEHLDLAMVIKMSQAISSEIVLEKLINALMRTALEQAGAERGLLILARDNEQRIEAEASSDRDKVTVHVRQSSVPARNASALANAGESPSELPESLLRYVIRTRESVTLHDATAENLFSEDEYIQRKRPRSVFCLPLIKQGKLVGVLYLENNLAPGVFTPNRLAILELIASQAAISLEQARLYAELSQENRDRKQAQEALRASEAKYRDLVDTTPAFIHTASPDGALDFLSRGWLEYGGLTLRDLKDWGWTAAIHPEDVEGFVDKWRAALASGEPFVAESRVRRADGEYRWFLQRNVPLRDETGKIVKWYGTGIDIEERKRADEGLRRSEAYLSEAQRLSHTGSFGWKPDTGEIIWSAETYRIFEYDPSGYAQQ